MLERIDRFVNKVDKVVKASDEKYEAATLAVRRRTKEIAITGAVGLGTGIVMRDYDMEAISVTSAYIALGSLNLLIFGYYRALHRETRSRVQSLVNKYLPTKKTK